MTRLVLSRDAPAIGFLIAWPFVYFWRVTLGQAVWYTRDISRMYYPYAVELSRALSEGRLPLWTPDLQGGFPLLAEGQSAALYLPHLLLIKLMAPEFAISFEMLFHLAWAAVGMYACVRGIGFHRASAFLAGFAFSFCGYLIQKLYHTPILLTAAWLPWLIFLLDRFQRAQRDYRRRAGVWFALTSLAAGFQWLIGFPQTALMNMLTAAAFGFFGDLFWNARARTWRERGQAIPRVAFWTLLPLLLGVGIASIQIVPTTELIGYSWRASGLSNQYTDIYPLPVNALAQFIAPLAPGEPSDDNVEIWGYVGLTTLVWAAAALALRRDSRTIFYFLFALIVLSLSLGSVNPVFGLLVHLPIFNFFRVPARYLLLFSFGAVLLCATTFEDLTQRVAESNSRKLSFGIAGVFVLIALVVIALADTPSFDFWLAVWRVLPWMLGALALIVLGLAWARRLERGPLSAAMIGLVIFDQSTYAATLLSTTVDRLSTPAYVVQVPRSVQALGPALEPERVLTDESIWPSVPALRSSLYPNFGAVYGRQMAHSTSPLAFAGVETYYSNLSPAMLNLMNVRLFAVPLEPRSADRAPTPNASLALDVVGKEAKFAPTAATAIQIDSFTEETSNLAASSIAANLTVRLDDGSTLTFPLHIGVETADWNWRQEHDTTTPPRQARVAHPVSAFVRSVGHPFEGDVYQAQFQLNPQGQSRRVVAISVQPIDVPRARLSIERISLLDENGRAISVAALTGKDDFKLVYMSDTAAIWENLNVMPRAFLAHRAEVMNPDQMLSRLRDPAFHADQTILLANGQPLAPSDAGDVSADRVEITQYLADQVHLSVTTNQSAYLFLGDTWYPGWDAFVDGKPVPIYLADYIFRAVPIEPGQHSVVFEYHPNSLVFGAIISTLCLVLVGVIAWAIRRNSRDQEGSDIGE